MQNTKWLHVHFNKPVYLSMELNWKTTALAIQKSLRIQNEGTLFLQVIPLVQPGCFYLLFHQEVPVQKKREVFGVQYRKKNVDQK